MFARNERIPREVLNSFRGSRTGNAFFTLRVQDNSLSRHRFAVVAGKKVDPKATARHTLKRRAAPILKKSMSGVGKDVLLLIQPPAKSLSRERFAHELHTVLASLHAIR